jgi:hypothetical protein
MRTRRQRLLAEGRQRQDGQPGPVDGIDRNRPPAEAPGGVYGDMI